MVTIVVTPSILDPINLPKLFILALGASLSCALFSLQIVSLWGDSKKAVLVVPITFLAALLASSIASQQGIFRTLVGVWGRNNGSLTYLSLVFIFLSLASMKSADSSRYLIKALTVLGLIGALYGWLQNADADVIDWDNPGNKIILTLGNSDFASSFLALTAIATLTFLLLGVTNVWKRSLLVFSFTVQLYLTERSDALHGFIILLLGSAILVGLWLTFSSRSFLRRFAVVWWATIFTTGVIGVSGLVGIGPFASYLSQNLKSLQDRYYFWIAGLNMIKDNPLFGIGIDSFGDYYRKYRTVEGIDLRGTALTGTNNAHNSIVQIGATGGLVLLGAYVFLIAFTVYRAYIALKTHKDKILVSGVFSIWISFQVQTLVSIDQIGLVVWGWAAAGCLVALSYYPETQIMKRANTLNAQGQNSGIVVDNKIVIFVILSFIPSIFLLPTLQNEFALRNKIVQLTTTNLSAESNFIKNEIYMISMRANQPELRLLAISYLLENQANDLALKLALDTTIEFPNSYSSWDALSSIYEVIGQKDKAKVARKVMIQLDPLNEEIKIKPEAEKSE